jgi:hypothetical protein
VETSVSNWLDRPLIFDVAKISGLKEALPLADNIETVRFAVLRAL